MGVESDGILWRGCDGAMRDGSTSGNESSWMQVGMKPVGLRCADRRPASHINTQLLFFDALFPTIPFPSFPPSLTSLTVFVLKSTTLANRCCISITLPCSFIHPSPLLGYPTKSGGFSNPGGGATYPPELVQSWSPCELNQPDRVGLGNG